MTEYFLGQYEESKDVYVTGTGQVLVRIHPPSLCEGRGCVIHHPSNHIMASFPTHWRQDRQLMERICPHGVGHPDPDHIGFVVLIKGQEAAYVDNVHGCDGCCKGEGPE